MWLHRDRAALGLAAAVAQIANEFLARVELCARGLVPIEIAHQTNAERDVVQIIAMHVAAVDLTPPALTDFDLAVTGRRSVTDHEMIRKTVLHPANMSMVVIEHARVALSRAAVMYDNELPPTPFHRCAPDRFHNRA